MLSLDLAKYLNREIWGYCFAIALNVNSACQHSERWVNLTPRSAASRLREIAGGKTSVRLANRGPDYWAIMYNVVKVQHKKNIQRMCVHYNDVIMGTIAPLITSLMIVCSNVYSDADQRKHQSSASLAFVWGIHRGPVNSPHKWPVMQKMFPFDDVIMKGQCCSLLYISLCQLLYLRDQTRSMGFIICEVSYTFCIHLPGQG